MVEKLLNYLENKKILILGFGKEGKSTYNFLRKHFEEKNLFISDKDLNLLELNPELDEDMFLEVSLGENYLNGIEQYDLIIKAPGISFKDIDISKFEKKITSQLELFLEFFEVKTIGVTGTKGKSTTSSLMYEVLKENDKDAFLLGNIGNPIFDEIENMTKNTYVVIELSSHALQYVKKSTNISILLNVHEEHLDHYKSYEEYVFAKMNIGINQNKDDVFIINDDDPEILRVLNENKEKVISKIRRISIKKEIADCFIKNNNIYLSEEKVEDITNLENTMNLKGMHNINNIMFILEAAKLLDLDINKSLYAIKKFNPLEHRMEFVAKIDDVEYYNDSIATIPSSTINAIEAIKNVNTLIVGGKDRGVSLKELYDYLASSNVENIICLPKTGEFIYEELKNVEGKRLYSVAELREAVVIAKKVTKKNKVCLLSPAASSYGYFKNFEERGRLFKEYVLDSECI